MHSSTLLFKQFCSTATKSSGVSFSTLAGMLRIGEAFLAFNFST